MSAGEQYSPQDSVFFDKFKSFFHGATYRLQKTESGCIVLSQKNLAMIHLIFSKETLPQMPCIDIMTRNGNGRQVGNSSSHATGVYSLC